MFVCKISVKMLTTDLVLGIFNILHLTSHKGSGTWCKTFTFLCLSASTEYLWFIALEKSEVPYTKANIALALSSSYKKGDSWGRAI